MVSVTAGEVSPLNAGGVFCSVLDACGEIFDLQRAQEWTSALEKWCESQPDLVPYRGNCLVRRAELLRIHGAWSMHLSKPSVPANVSQTQLPRPPLQELIIRLVKCIVCVAASPMRKKPIVRQVSGNAFPDRALPNCALRRVRWTLPVQPFVAPSKRQRNSDRVPVVLDAYVEIMLAAGDVAAARVAADELAAIASGRDVLFVRALSCRAAGAVLLAEGNAQGALTELRQSWNIWCELQAPDEAARVRLLLARACRELRDEENALVELTAAREQFQQLGAAVDLARAEALFDKPTRPAAGSLTDRELQVLKLVASGLTNRGIAGRLHISEKTVARHLSNIFTKLDLYSRSAATAYAFNHGLV